MDRTMFNSYARDVSKKVAIDLAIANGVPIAQVQIWALTV